MPPAGFEPIKPVSEWPQTHALDRTATAIGYYWALKSSKADPSGRAV
jgi:hypothetical protein